MPLGSFRLNSLSRRGGPPPRTAVTTTAFGNAKISTAQSKFGGASALFDGTGDRLNVAAGTITGDFTLEFFIRWNSLANNFQYPLGRGGNDPGMVQIQNLNTDDLRFNFRNGANHLRTFDFVNVITINTWYHYALEVENDIIRFYIDGVQKLPTTGAEIDWETTLFNNSSGIMYLGGASFNDQWFNGYIDEVRVSNVARYNSNFTPPTAAFTNDANTVVLLHMDGTNGSTTFTDDTA
jgi:hypothetical protein